MARNDDEKVVNVTYDGRQKYTEQLDVAITTIHENFWSKDYASIIFSLQHFKRLVSHYISKQSREDINALITKAKNKYRIIRSNNQCTYFKTENVLEDSLFELLGDIFEKLMDAASHLFLPRSGDDDLNDLDESEFIARLRSASH